MAEQNVLIAVDGSEKAVQAVQYYLKFVHREGFKPFLVHVVELPDKGHARQQFLTPGTLAELWEEEIKNSKKLEAKFQEILANAGVSSVALHIANGVRPGQVVCKTAQDQNALMIIVGTRGMGTIRRTILGSVSDYIIHHAHCPVIVCRDADHVA